MRDGSIQQGPSGLGEGEHPRALCLKAGAPTGKFWIAALTAALLTFLSYVSPLVIPSLNRHIFNSQGYDDPGGWLYLLVRLSITGFLIWTILNFKNGTVAPERIRTATGTSRLFDPLMGLRALACFFVLMGHYFLIVLPFSDSGASIPVQMTLRAPAWCGVWIFFTLSGYLMGKGFVKKRYSLDEAGSKLFWRNRALRIVPVYVVSVLLVALFRYRDIFEPRHLWMLGEIFIFDFGGGIPIQPIAALWSVSTEVQFYMLVPALTVILFRLRAWAGKSFIYIPLVFLGIGNIARLLLAVRGPNQMYLFGYVPLITNLDLFVAGMSINFLTLPAKRTVGQRWKLGWCLAASALVFYLMMGLSLRSMPHFHVPIEQIWAVGPIFCALFAAAFIWVAEAIGVVTIPNGITGSSLFVIQWMGTLTYCIYVFHSDIMMLNAEAMPKLLSLGMSLTRFPLVMLEIFLVSGFFYFVLERPFDLKKRVTASSAPVRVR